MDNLHMPIGEYYTAEWYEYIPPVTTEDEPAYESFSETFYYTRHIDNKGIRYPIPGMRATNTGLEITISTTSDLPFKELDKVKFQGNRLMTIKSIEEDVDTENEMATFNFPGAVEEYKTYVIRFNS